MENPATWGTAERVICDAYIEWHEASARGVIGVSLPRYIADALRDAQLLVDPA